MIADFPLHRFEEFGNIGPAELNAIIALGDTPREYPRQTVIRPEGVVDNGFYLLLEGWAAACITLPDGGRQILKIHLPGDALGTPSMSVTRTVELLVTITPVVIAPVPFDRFGRLFDEHPRLAANFLMSVQRERIALMDQLASIGRTSADARVAAFLIDLLERLEPLGTVHDDSFDMPLTQEQIGDLLGLTGVHVNRTLRSLERHRLIARDRQRYTILDRAALNGLAARPMRSLRRDAPWLPASR